MFLLKTKVVLCSVTEGKMLFLMGNSKDNGLPECLGLTSSNTDHWSVATFSIDKSTESDSSKDQWLRLKRTIITVRFSERSILPYINLLVSLFNITRLDICIWNYDIETYWSFEELNFTCGVCFTLRIIQTFSREHYMIQK